ncbi:anti-sigma factor [Chenggangzhangella methanolivorans]|uniref:Anti-sigma factor n=1 Tax=Chenggangzhangella methanolivorans TaxID=1437009 RepID=A0A9E6RE43_9HYPH|nr:anti-sigma factor [Chenggangzhangella methanolivorans]QZO01738.1 anti-sigma factor [Chenggangzhangella methanolivorans]
MTTIGWDEINAYVDRELDASASAAVAAAIARDPSLAARVATLSKLKAEAVGLPAPTEAPPFPARPAGRRPVASWRPLALAASIALLLAAGAGAWLSRAPGADPLAATVAAERGWLAGATPEASGAGVRVAVETGASSSLPDLSAAELRLAYLAADPVSDGRRGLFAGYVGPHGCRLGLWIGRGAARSAPEAVDVGDVRVRRWSADGASYALMSRGMDPLRLDRFAAVIADLASPGRTLDDGLRIALKEASTSGGACTG